VEWSEWADDVPGEPVPSTFDRTWRHPSELGSASSSSPIKSAKPVGGFRSSYLATGAVIIVSASLTMLVIVPFISKMHVRSDASAPPNTGLAQQNAGVLTADPRPPVATTATATTAIATTDDTWSAETPADIAETALETTTAQTFQRPSAAAPTSSRTQQPVPSIPPLPSPQTIEGPTTTVGGIVRLVVTHTDGSTNATSGVRLDSRTVVVPMASWTPGDSVSSTASDGTTVEAAMVGIDRNSRLAVLDVPHDDEATKARLATCHDINRGGTVGVSTGDDNATNGVITELATQTDSGPTSPLLKVSSSVALGRPPIVTRDGAVLALGVSVDGRDINAVPADLVASAADAVRNGRAVDGRIGLFGYDFVDLGASTSSGALVTKVALDSPAALSGIVNGDVITQIDDHAVRNWWDLLLVMRTTHAAATVHVTLRRPSTANSPELIKTVDVTLDTWMAPAA
jgi:S1-C subfamily serine protease